MAVRIHFPDDGVFRRWSSAAEFPWAGCTTRSPTLPMLAHRRGRAPPRPADPDEPAPSGRPGGQDGRHDPATGPGHRRRRGGRPVHRPRLLRLAPRLPRRRHPCRRPAAGPLTGPDETPGADRPAGLLAGGERRPAGGVGAVAAPRGRLDPRALRGGARGAGQGRRAAAAGAGRDVRAGVPARDALRLAVPGRGQALPAGRVHAVPGHAAGRAGGPVRAARSRGHPGAPRQRHPPAPAGLGGPAAAAPRTGRTTS